MELHTHCSHKWTHMHLHAACEAQFQTDHSPLPGHGLEVGDPCATQLGNKISAWKAQRESRTPQFHSIYFLLLVLCILLFLLLYKTISSIVYNLHSFKTSVNIIQKDVKNSPIDFFSDQKRWIAKRLHRNEKICNRK